MFYTLIAYVLLIQFIVSLFLGGKRFSAEALMVLQVTYASLVTIDNLNPLNAAILKLSPANNAYNLFNSSFEKF